MSPEINQQPESDRIQPEMISQVRDVLQSLPTKTQDPMSVEEAIAQLQDSLQAALLKWYSYEELAHLLQQEGIPINSSSLENYLASTKRWASENKISTTPEDQHSDGTLEPTTRSTTTEQTLPINSGSPNLSNKQLQKIQELAQVYGIPFEVLLQKSLEDWANFPESVSDEATDYVLTKNAELYRRLA